MKKTKFFISAMFIAVATLTTSCLGDDTKDNSIVTGVYCTLTGSNPNYILYGDGGAVITPTASSVQTMTNSKGFEGARRAFISFKYTPNTAETDKETGLTYINDAELQAGYVIQVSDILKKLDAEDAKITAPDSSFSIMQFNQMWVYNGYMNTMVTGYYSGNDKTNFTPSVNLVYSPSDIKENEITLHLYYNRHSEQSASPKGYYSFEDSFDLSEIANIIPGDKDVTINVVTDKDSYTKTQTVARKHLKFVAYPLK